MASRQRSKLKVALFAQVKSQAIAETLIRQVAISLLFWGMFEIYMLLSWSASFPLLSVLLVVISIRLLFNPQPFLAMGIIVLSIVAFAAAFIKVPGVYAYNPFVAFILFMLGIRVLEGTLFLQSEKAS
ncbi:MAG: hypothetical protein OXE99_02650 [Cellvibrionales bacterium]|nr:hypothetical protein [Cellvibrionales bacterium]